MPWVTFTEDDVRAIVPEREWETFDSLASKRFPDSNGDDVTRAPSKFPAVIAQVCNKFRGAIRANVNGPVYMGPDGTLPDFCIADAAVIARDRMLGIPSVEIGFTNPRQKENEAALKFLESLKDMPSSAFAEDDPNPSDAAGVYGGESQLEW